MSLIRIRKSVMHKLDPVQPVTDLNLTTVHALPTHEQVAGWARNCTVRTSCHSLDKKCEACRPSPVLFFFWVPFFCSHCVMNRGPSSSASTLSSVDSMTMPVTTLPRLSHYPLPLRLRCRLQSRWQFQPHFLQHSQPLLLLYQVARYCMYVSCNLQQFYNHKASVTHTQL